MWLNLLGIDCNQFLRRAVQGCSCKALSELINGGLECSGGRDKVVAAAAVQSAASRPAQVQGQPLDPLPLSPLHTAPWQKCQNKTEQLETHEKHSWNLRGKERNSFAKDNKNNNNLIFITITVMTVVVIMTGHLILSSAL